MATGSLLTATVDGILSIQQEGLLANKNLLTKFMITKTLNQNSKNELSKKTAKSKAKEFDCSSVEGIQEQVRRNFTSTELPTSQCRLHTTYI